MQPSDLEDLLNTNMPYGKYKNIPIANLPANYLEWFARQGFPDGKIGHLLKLAHEMQLNGLIDLLAPLRRK